MATLKDQIARWNLSTRRGAATPEPVCDIAGATAQSYVVDLSGSAASKKKNNASKGVDFYATNPDGSVKGVFSATGLCPKVSEKTGTYGISLSDGMFEPVIND